ncbi:hypothetical protein P3T32_003194 [Ralstonia sp. GP73]|jgi:hypothetical protein|uniref:Uncharacterized protein n=2 Tax=Ralstonia TaxID=48736 RepID=A0AAD2BRL3_9RALS|nr:MULTISPECIES: DUF3658 domain-containing protein [Ralstonia]MBT2178503.1 DUF1835 domain-containing protein [Ralstonia pickettii]MCL6456023.1 DUF1835 domain-containing protein [Ralstonia pickettii]MDH6643337.1 hypothetical protein [Ralstonia sp. GP73]OCS45218.1 DNA repair protein [Ralstonia pickettii]CAJ0718189.1 hypothetical protein LMG7143_04321 [Ralstonia sp. LMG 18095]
MQYIHVVNGEVAGATLKQALAQAGRPDSVVVLRDDLAVGPLVDVDSVAMARSGFWQRVAPNSNIDFAAEMRDALASLADLRDATTEVAIWHGQSASDQLMLRRVAFHLHQSPQRINEVGMDVRELEAPNGQGPLTTIGMYSGARLARRFSTIAPVSVLRIGRLAYEWQQTVRENADTRLWKGNTLVPVSYGTVDEVILEQVPTDWASARDVVGSIMGAIDGLLASDWFVFWRCRELVGNGQLLLRGEADSLSTCELRRNVSVAV